MAHSADQADTIKQLVEGKLHEEFVSNILSCRTKFWAYAQYFGILRARHASPLPSGVLFMAAARGIGICAGLLCTPEGLDEAIHFSPIDISGRGGGCVRPTGIDYFGS